jgi:hypothetical protein
MRAFRDRALTEEMTGCHTMFVHTDNDAAKAIGFLNQRDGPME